MKKYKWLMKKDLYEEHIKTFNCFLENKLIHNHNSYEYIVEYNKYLEDKIERLNNIINELEKWLKEEIDCYDSQEKGVIKFTYCDIMDKLQELKGEDKE